MVGAPGMVEGFYYDANEIASDWGIWGAGVRRAPRACVRSPTCLFDGGNWGTTSIHGPRRCEFLEGWRVVDISKGPGRIC